MSNRLQQLILGLAVTGMTAAAWAQGAPDATPGGGGPGGPNGPPHAWHDGEGAGRGEHRQWGGDEHRDGEWGHGGHHHHHHHHHRHHGGWRGGEGARGGAGMVFRGLNLTGEQQLKMRTIVMTAKLSMLQQAGAHKPGAAGDRTALLNPGDPNYKAAVEAAKKHAADRIQRMSDLKLQLYNVLTPEQKSEFAKRISEWKTRMAQRTEGSKGPPAPAAR
jgi:Spy/CpxP family protein refolding chaperone